ncbi:MAG TPA: DUF3189 family protein [Firmicutes bacterium]|mgnify:CR=1 FL=1|nr:DUF3189 family protein [Bacillota bacterium]
MIAAHLHLGRLPMDRPVQVREILALPLFDRAQASDFGIPCYMGTDTLGHAVYIIGFGSGARECSQAMESVLGIMGWAGEVFLVDVLDCIGVTARLGGMLSRRLGWVSLGRPLAAWGMLRSLEGLRRLVQSVKEVLASRHG